MDKTEIQKFYKNQTIFLTGGTGFIGKILIVKLLLTCPDLNKLYLIIRPKRSKTAAERFNEIFNIQCFDILKKSMPNFAEKIQLIDGDCGKPQLGLKNEDWEVLKKEVTIIIHVAANVKFDQDIRTASYSNVKSVIELLHLAKEMKLLKALVHVSTAYSNSPNLYIEETFYEPGLKEKQLSSLIDTLDDEALEAVTPHLLKKWPNTYTFTKCIAEDVIKNQGEGLPIAIVRPAIIVSAAEFPMIGWIDNFYGLIGITAGQLVGAIKSIVVKKNVYLHCVPCDYVANNIIAAAWDLSMRKFDKNKPFPDQVPIYNYVGINTSFTLQDLSVTANTLKWKYPLNVMFWYPIFCMTESITYHRLREFFLQIIPSYIIDFVFLCMGKERIAVKKYKQISKLVDLTSYFTTHFWYFNYNNVKILWNKMSEDDQKLYPFNMDGFNWEKFWGNAMKFGRLYLFNESVDLLPKAKTKLYVFAFINYSLFALFVYFMFKIIFWVLCLIF